MNKYCDMGFCDRKLTLVAMVICTTLAVQAQQRSGLDEILGLIETRNPVGKMYDADIRSMDAAAKGARSWMPPEVGAGFFMTPYNPRRWRKMEEEPGMGFFSVSLQQMIPSKRKLDADAAYMQSMPGATREQKTTALHLLYADAKKTYYTWVALERKRAVLKENERILSFMVHDAEIRYKNGLEKINAYYKAKAALGQVQQMQQMVENDIAQQRIRLNMLAFRDPLTSFVIDTAVQRADLSALTWDSAKLNAASDVRAVEREIYTLQLRTVSERQSLRPQFGIRFEHMAGFGGQPQQFTLMGMVRLPFVPWAARMAKANIDSYRWKMTALENQKNMLVNEKFSMAAGMRREWLSMQQQLSVYENNILPALKNYYKTMLLAYGQNTGELFMLFDAWESLNMAQTSYIDQWLKAMLAQAEIERILQIRKS